MSSRVIIVAPPRAACRLRVPAPGDARRNLTAPPPRPIGHATPPPHPIGRAVPPPRRRAPGHPPPASRGCARRGRPRSVPSGSWRFRLPPRPRRWRPPLKTAFLLLALQPVRLPRLRQHSFREIEPLLEVAQARLALLHLLEPAAQRVHLGLQLGRGSAAFQAPREGPDER